MVKTNNSTDTPVELLNTAYKQLEFDRGALLPAVRHPQPGTQEDWLDRGDWQSLAAQVGAEKVFFVDRDPVVEPQQRTADTREVLERDEAVPDLGR